MNIPDEVKLAALQATDRDGWMIGKIDPALEVVAEWARREALREAENALVRAQGGWALELGIRAIRALAEGEQA